MIETQLLGFVIAVSIIFIVAGLAMIWNDYRHNRQTKQIEQEWVRSHGMPGYPGKPLHEDESDE